MEYVDLLPTQPLHTRHFRESEKYTLENLINTFDKIIIIIITTILNIQLNVRCKVVAVPTLHCDRDQLWSRAMLSADCFVITLHVYLLLYHKYICHYITSIFVIILRLYLSLHTCIFHCVTFHYNYITLHWKAGIALNCMTLHCIAVLQWQYNAWHCMIRHEFAMQWQSEALKGYQQGEFSAKYCQVLSYIA